MRTKLSIYNITGAVILQIVNLVAYLVLQKIILNEYGSAVNGLVFTIKQYITYFNLVEAGLAGAAVYALYKPLAEKNKDDIDGILSASNRFYNIAGFMFSALVLLAAFIYPLLTSGQGISAFTIASLFLIIGTSGALEFFAVGKYKVLFTADQKSYVISLINAAAVTVNAVIIVIMAIRHYDIVTVQLIALISFFLRSVLYTLYGRWKYSNFNFKAPPKNEALDKRWDSLILQILGVVTTATPVLVTSLICGYKEVSVFNVYNMVFVSVLALLSTFNNGLSAMFGDLLVRKELNILQRIYNQYEFMYYGLMTWGYACAAILIMPFIEIYTRNITDVNYLRPSLAVLFVAVGILYNIKTPQGMLVISAGLYKETKLQTLLQAVINLVFSVALAPFFGIVGVLIGSVLSNLYRDIDLIFYIPKTVTKLKPSATVRRVARLVALFFAAVLPVVIFVDLKPENLIKWFLFAIPVSVWAFIIIAGGNIILERKTTAEILFRLHGLFTKKGLMNHQAPMINKPAPGS